MAAGGFGLMRTYAEQRMKANGSAGRAPYSITTNNCCTFAREVAEAGGAAVGLPLGLGGVLLGMTILPKVAELLGSVALTAASPIPNAFLDHLLSAHPGFEFKPKDSWASIGRGSLAV